MKNQFLPAESFLTFLLFAFTLLGLPSQAEQPELIDEVPKDFFIRSSVRDVGVIPRHEERIEISRDAKVDRFILKWSDITKVGGEQDAQPVMVQTLSDEEVLEVYQKVVELGIFDLKNRYLPKEIETGGSTHTVTVTANGVTKRVFIASGMKVPEIEKLTGLVRGRALRKAKK